MKMMGTTSKKIQDEKIKIVDYGNYPLVHTGGTQSLSSGKEKALPYRRTRTNKSTDRGQSWKITVWPAAQ